MRARRLPFIDEYVEDGESAVLINEQVVVLSGLATRLLSELGPDWSELDELTTALVDAFGAPPGGADAHAATRQALLVLERQGLVETNG